MNTASLSQKTHSQARKSVEYLSVSAGFAQITGLVDMGRLKAYIKDHEAWALILLAIFLIAGTVFYVDLQPGYDGRTAQNPKNAQS